MGEINRKELEMDIRGQICPSALLTALKEMNLHRAEIKAGDVRISFRTDNRDATVTIPDAATNMGYDVEVRKDGDHYLITVEAFR